jgi:Rho termination factor, N-terminal domain
MFINTSNRFTKFTTNHKTAIDTLLLLVQIVAIATALLGLLSILGWALAITKAIAWLNRLVEDSIEPQRLLMPAKELSPPTVSDTAADEILAEWREKAASRGANLPHGGDRSKAPIGDLKTQGEAEPLQELSIRQLKKLASDRHISKYSVLTKKELILALN